MAETPAPARSREQVLDLLRQLRSTYAGRNADMLRRRRIYDGDHWDENNPPREGRYTITLNYVRPTVLGAVRDLTAQMPGFQVMPRGTDEEARRVAEGAEGVLYRCWDENDFPSFLRRISFNQALLGLGWGYYWWDPKRKMTRIRSVAPENVYPLWDGDDLKELVFVSRRLTPELQAMYPREEIRSDEDQVSHSRSGTLLEEYSLAINPSDPGRRLTPNYTTVVDWYDDDGYWVRVMGDVTVHMRLGYGAVPFVPFPGNTTGDESDPEPIVTDDLIDLNQYLDQLISQQADIIRKYANPVILDEATGQSPVAIRQIVQGDGGVIPLRAGGNLRFLNWDGPQPAIFDQLSFVQQAFFDLSGRPAASYGQTVTNQSGVMTNLSLTPTVTAAEDRANVVGRSLSLLNEAILRLFEKFASDEDLSYEGYVPSGKGPATEYVSTPMIKGRDLDGWYRNRIKWPAILRTDDPVYVQNELQKMQSDPPAQSIYTTLENLGIEDVEAELDRIATQLEDPRFHPDRLQSAVQAASAFGQADVPPDLAGFVDGGSLGSGLVDAAEASGSPNTAALADLAGQ